MWAGRRSVREKGRMGRRTGLEAGLLARARCEGWYKVISNIKHRIEHIIWLKYVEVLLYESDGVIACSNDFSAKPVYHVYLSGSLMINRLAVCGCTGRNPVFVSGFGFFVSLRPTPVYAYPGLVLHPQKTTLFSSHLSVRACAGFVFVIGVGLIL